MSLTLSTFDISRIVPVYEVIRIRSFESLLNKRKRPLVEEALKLSFSFLKQCFKDFCSLLRSGQSFIIMSFFKEKIECLCALTGKPLRFMICFLKSSILPKHVCKLLTWSEVIWFFSHFSWIFCGLVNSTFCTTCLSGRLGVMPGWLCWPSPTPWIYQKE